MRNTSGQLKPLNGLALIESHLMTSLYFSCVKWVSDIIGHEFASHKVRNILPSQSLSETLIRL